MQQVKRVGIFTKHTMQPKHPRIQMEREILEANGYEVEVVSNAKGIKGNQGSLWQKLRYYLSFTYFHWPLIARFGKELHRFDAVIIYDFAFLPLLARARRLGKHVVYETIDNNVEYSFHALVERMPMLKVLKGWVTGRMKRYELHQAGRVAHKTIVNSLALRDYIATPNIIVNLYASPFEQVRLEDAGDKPLAYLYLGEYTLDKGGDLMLDIAEQTGRPFFVFGNVKGDALKNRMQQVPSVEQQDRMQVGDLLGRLKLLSQSHRLAGLSLIKPVNLSFATQEANKDIDYMALGIPLVGNERGITKEKIDAGCGVLYSDAAAMQRLAEDSAYYAQIATQGRSYYQQYYSKAAFTRGLLEALKSK